MCLTILYRYFLFTGIVVHISRILPLMEKGFFRCSLCRAEIDDVEVENGRLKEPADCIRCLQSHREKNEEFKGETYSLIHNRCTFKNR